MNGQRIGYKRVSSVDQNPARQLEGVEVDRIFPDKISGKNTKQPLLRLSPRLIVAARQWFPFVLVTYLYGA